MNGQLVPSLREGEPATAFGRRDLQTDCLSEKLPMPPFKDQLTESEMRRVGEFHHRGTFRVERIDIASKQAMRWTPKMKILITGASGLVGTAL